MISNRMRIVRDNYPPGPRWRQKIYEIIFEADTPAGLAFDVGLLIAIVVSVIGTCLKTVPALAEYESRFEGFEVFVGILFSIEFLLRVICVRRPSKYIFSFFGIVDLLSILPLYIVLVSSLIEGTEVDGSSFAVVRSLRLLRAFRVLRLSWLQSEAEDLGSAIWRSRAKVVVFLATVMITVTIAGSLMYEIENRHHSPDKQFSDIPQSIYWAIVTMTTVGYGDIVPVTTSGKIVSAILILLGYSLIIVPTGFVSAEMANLKRGKKQKCNNCLLDQHEADAKFCRSCGSKLA
jgi:voltage-gated potassium channel